MYYSYFTSAILSGTHASSSSRSSKHRDRYSHISGEFACNIAHNDHGSLKRQLTFSLERISSYERLTQDVVLVDNLAGEPLLVQIPAVFPIFYSLVPHQSVDEGRLVLAVPEDTSHCLQSLRQPVIGRITRGLGWTHFECPGSRE